MNRFRLGVLAIVAMFLGVAWWWLNRKVLRAKAEAKSAGVKSILERRSATQAQREANHRDVAAADRKYVEAVREQAKVQDAINKNEVARRSLRPDDVTKRLDRAGL